MNILNGADQPYWFALAIELQLTIRRNPPPYPVARTDDLVVHTELAFASGHVQVVIQRRLAPLGRQQFIPVRNVVRK